MANVVVPDEAKINWLQAIIDQSAILTGNCYLRLLGGDIVVDRYTTISQCSANALNLIGLEPQELKSWTAPVLPAQAAITEAETAEFTISEEQTADVYGVYATNGLGDKLWFVAKFANPVPMPFPAPLQVDVQIDLDSIFSQ